MADVKTDKDAILEVREKYRQSIVGCDLKLAREVWATDRPEVSLFWSMGRMRNWKEIEGVFYPKAMGSFKKRVLDFKPANVSIYGDFAWAEFDWEWDAEFRDEFDHELAGEAHEITYGRETMVLIRGSHGWEIVHIHYSVEYPNKPGFLP